MMDLVLRFLIRKLSMVVPTGKGIVRWSGGLVIIVFPLVLLLLA